MMDFNGMIECKATAGQAGHLNNASRLFGRQAGGGQVNSLVAEYMANVAMMMAATAAVMAMAG